MHLESGQAKCTACYSHSIVKYSMSQTVWEQEFVSCERVDLKCKSSGGMLDHAPVYDSCHCKVKTQRIDEHTVCDSDRGTVGMRKLPC